MDTHTEFSMLRWRQILFWPFSSTDYLSAYAEATLKLELYDMVQIDKFHDAAPDIWKNYFEGWMMP